LLFPKHFSQVDKKFWKIPLTKWNSLSPGVILEYYIQNELHQHLSIVVTSEFRNKIYAGLSGNPLISAKTLVCKSGFLGL
jgi:hypothetical protein